MNEFIVNGMYQVCSCKKHLWSKHEQQVIDRNLRLPPHFWRAVFDPLPEESSYNDIIKHTLVFLSFVIVVYLYSVD